MLKVVQQSFSFNQLINTSNYKVTIMSYKISKLSGKFNYLLFTLVDISKVKFLEVCTSTIFRVI